MFAWSNGIWLASLDKSVKNGIKCQDIHETITVKRVPYTAHSLVEITYIFGPKRDEKYHTIGNFISYNHVT
jgi:hypothetical protein